MATSLAVGGKEDNAVFFWLSFALSLYLTAFFYAPLQSHMRIISTQFSMSIPQFIVPHFIVPHRCFALYKLKTGPATSKMITTHFIAMVWSIYLRYACIWSWRDIFWRLAEMCFFVWWGVFKSCAESQLCRSDCLWPCLLFSHPKGWHLQPCLYNMTLWIWNIQNSLFVDYWQQRPVA